MRAQLEKKLVRGEGKEGGHLRALAQKAREERAVSFQANSEKDDDAKERDQTSHERHKDAA